MNPMKKTSHREHNPFRVTHALGLLLLGSILLFPLATQAGFWDGALKFGKQLLATAAGNYTNQYQQDLTQLLQALRQPGTNQNPYGQQPPQQNPYAQQDYPQAPYGQPPPQQDPYAQQNDPQAPYGQPPPQQDPYAQQNDPQDAYGQPPPQQNPYAQQDDPQDAYGQPPPQQNPYAQQDDPQAPYGQQPMPSGYPNDPSNQQENSYDPYGEQESARDQTERTAYSGTTGTIGAPIGLDVAIVKKTVINGAETLAPINDGDVLKDGRGNAHAGDKFRIMFRANCDCYIYVIAIDGSAWAQGLYPNLTSPFANPVKQGQQYIIPENNNWLSLDQFKGIETLFFVASPEKRQDIEDIVANIAGKERHPKATPQQVTEAPIIPAGYYRSQTGSSPFIIGQGSSIPQGQDHNLIPTTYFTQKAGEALRVTRWFRHE